MENRPPADAHDKTSSLSTFLHAIHQINQLMHLGWAGVTAGYVLGGVMNRPWPSAERSEGPQPDDTLSKGQVAGALFEKFAKEQLADGFSVLYEVVIVRLVSILDAMVLHFVRQRLRAGQPARLLDSVKQLEGPLIEFANASDEEQARLLAELLQERLKAKHKLGVGSYETLLNAIGYGGGVQCDVRRTLLELLEIRNVIVHRLGIVDAQLVDRCLWLNLTVGDTVRARKHEFIRYLQACTWYAMELSLRAQRAGEVEADASPEEHRAAQAEMIEGLRSPDRPGGAPQES
jgi:hypothetical protein